MIYPAVGMIIMVLEAANQLADQSRPITGFKLTNTYLAAALVIPPTPEGIETQLHAHPIRDESDRASQSWEFRLTSCEDGQWHEHCHGKVQVDYEMGQIEIDGGREERERLKSRQEAHLAVKEGSKWVRTKEQFYKSAWKSGYTFGPSFCAMDNITFSDCLGLQVTADVKCFEWKAVENANHFQEHIIHPTTLDGILQTSLAVFSRAGEDIVTTAVPTEIEYLWISKSGLSYPQAESVKSRSRLVSQGNIGFETMTTAMDNSLEKVLLDAKGIRLRFVTGSFSIPEQINGPHMCYNLDWKPDIDLFITSTQSSNDESEALEYLNSYLDLAAFKEPAMKILHFTLLQDTTQKLLLDRFFRLSGSEIATTPHAEYKLVDLSKTPLDKLTSSLEEFSGLTIAKWHLGEPYLDEPQMYDLIFCPWVSSIPSAASCVMLTDHLVHEQDSSTELIKHAYELLK
jgi:hypothetical protein